MKITRHEAALLVIEEILAKWQSTYPKHDRKSVEHSANKAYEVAHAARNPGCMKAHPEWGKPIDDFMRAQSKGKAR